MGRRGPTRQSETKMRLTGSDWGKRHAKRDAAVARGLPTGCPRMPSGLSDAAKTEWRRICPLLEKAGLMSPLYRALLVAYVTTWARLLDMDERLDHEGHVLHTADGKPYKHPLCSLRKSAADFLLKVSCEFGLTPASRSRVSGAAIPPTPKERPKYCGHADFPVDAG